MRESFSHNIHSSITKFEARAERQVGVENVLEIAREFAARLGILLRFIGKTLRRAAAI